MPVGYVPSIFTLNGRKQLKKVYKSNENGFRLKFFIIGEGGVDNNGIPKVPLNTTTRLECEGNIVSNVVSFVSGSNTATGNTSGLVVGNYIRPNFDYNNLINIGYIKWYRIENIVGSTIILNRTYTEPNFNGNICKNTTELYGFVKQLSDSDLTYKDDYTLDVLIYLSMDEGNGYTGNVVGFSENGLYDNEFNLIGYSNFAKISKNNTIELIRHFELGF